MIRGDEIEIALRFRDTRDSDRSDVFVRSPRYYSTGTIQSVHILCVSKCDHRELRELMVGVDRRARKQSAACRGNRETSFRNIMSVLTSTFSFFFFVDVRIRRPKCPRLRYIAAISRVLWVIPHTADLVLAFMTIIIFNARRYSARCSPSIENSRLTFS